MYIASLPATITAASIFRKSQLWVIKMKDSPLRVFMQLSSTYIPTAIYTTRQALIRSKIWYKECLSTESLYIRTYIYFYATLLNLLISTTNLRSNEQRINPQTKLKSSYKATTMLEFSSIDNKNINLYMTKKSPFTHSPSPVWLFSAVTFILPYPPFLPSFMLHYY